MTKFTRQEVDDHIESRYVTSCDDGLIRYVIRTKCGFKAFGDAHDIASARIVADMMIVQNDICFND